MQFVASHTAIPVPKVHKIHTDEHRHIYIEMAYVPGDTLDGAWDRLSTYDRDAVMADIKQHITSLRELQPPVKQDLVASALQNPAYDGRIGARFYGPMNHDEFHSLARGRLVMEDVAPFLGEEVAQVHAVRRYQTCFTHADLAPRNIIVRRGRVAAIIDWAYAGWYPEYWEFTKAHYTYFPGEGWEDYLDRLLPGFELELTAERILWSRLPEPGTAGAVAGDGVYHELPGSSPSRAWLDARVGRRVTDLWSLALSRGYDSSSRSDMTEV